MSPRERVARVLDQHRGACKGPGHPDSSCNDFDVAQAIIAALAPELLVANDAKQVVALERELTKPTGSLRDYDFAWQALVFDVTALED